MFNFYRDFKTAAHSASVLLLDLKNIERYIEEYHGKNAEYDIRYTSDWQKLIIDCPFLSIEQTNLLNTLYDTVYKFNYDF